MREIIGADSLAFLSIDGMYRAMGEPGRDPVQSEIRGPLLHRRLSDPPHRPDPARAAAAAIVAAGGGERRRAVLVA